MEGHKSYKFKNVRLEVFGDLIIHEYEKVDEGYAGSRTRVSSGEDDEQQRHQKSLMKSDESTFSGRTLWTPDFRPDPRSSDASSSSENKPRNGSETLRTGPTSLQPLVFESVDSFLSRSQMQSILALR